MKRLAAFLLTIVLMGFAAQAKKISDSKAGLDIEVNETTHDFGNISDKSPVTTEFTLTNCGNSPIVIISAAASCGCTHPKYTTKPIAPGEKAKVEVTFNPKGRAGEIFQNVKLRLKSASSKGTKRINLNITGVVIPETSAKQGAKE